MTGTAAAPGRSAPLDELLVVVGDLGDECPGQSGVVADEILGVAAGLLDHHGIVGQ